MKKKHQRETDGETDQQMGTRTKMGSHKHMDVQVTVTVNLDTGDLKTAPGKILA